MFELSFIIHSLPRGHAKCEIEQNVATFQFKIRSCDYKMEFECFYLAFFSKGYQLCVCICISNLLIAPGTTCDWNIYHAERGIFHLHLSLKEATKNIVFYLISKKHSQRDVMLRTLSVRKMFCYLTYRDTKWCVLWLESNFCYILIRFCWCLWDLRYWYV